MEMTNAALQHDSDFFESLRISSTDGANGHNPTSTSEIQDRDALGENFNPATSILHGLVLRV